ncbi:hypothetical protein ACVWWP_002672 [Bradyrhizobium sp. LM3.6]
MHSRNDSGPKARSQPARVRRTIPRPQRWTTWPGGGQTLAAQDLCTGVRAYRRVHHMQAGVGHYGVFSGKRWNNEIYPLLRDFVHVNS